MAEEPASVFAQELARQTVEIWSPDGNIVVLLTNGEPKDLGFRPGTYDRYTETALATQLGQLAKLTFVERTRGRRQAMKTAFDRAHDVQHREAVSPSTRRFRDERDKTLINDESRNIIIAVEGGQRWEVAIEPGTIEELSEEEFTDELFDLVARSITHWRNEMDALRIRIFGPSEMLRRLRHSNIQDATKGTR